MKNYVPSVFDFIVEGKLQVESFPDVMNGLDECIDIIKDYSVNARINNSIDKFAQDQTPSNYRLGECTPIKEFTVIVNFKAVKFHVYSIYKELYQDAYFDEPSSDEKNVYLYVSVYNIINSTSIDKVNRIIAKIKELLYHEASHALSFILNRRIHKRYNDVDISKTAKAEYDRQVAEIDAKNRELKKPYDEWKKKTADWNDFYRWKYYDKDTGKFKYDLNNRPSEMPEPMDEPNYLKYPDIKDIKKKIYNDNREPSYYYSVDRFDGDMDSIIQQWFYQFFNDDERESFKSLVYKINNPKTIVKYYQSNMEYVNKLVDAVNNPDESLNDKEWSERFKYIKDNLVIKYPRYKTYSTIFCTKIFIKKLIMYLERFKRDLLNNWYRINKSNS